MIRNLTVLALILGFAMSARTEANQLLELRTYHFASTEKQAAFETFLIEMTGSAMAKLGVGLSGLETLRSTLLEDLLADLRILSRSANGFSVAAHCLCRVD